MVTALPKYAGIYSLAKNKPGVVTARIKADMLYDNLFATKTGNGWYLIVGESDWELYKDSYIQLGITLILSLLLFAIIIILYIVSQRSRRKTEEALAAKDKFLESITGEFHTPLQQILDSSARENVVNVEDYQENFARIHAAGKKVSDMLRQIISYSSLVKSENQREERKKAGKLRVGLRKSVRTGIISFMALVMVISLYTNISATISWGNSTMKEKAESYEYQLAEWINTQKSILDMFCSIISTNPDMLKDYDGTIHYLDQITKQYPEISVSYMANPELNPTVFMNNGWLPDADWKVEERPWYKDLMASEQNWIVSAPYYDEQTGGYCVTFAEKVYDAKTGEFLGNFGIDFFMEKLVNILGDSYSDTGYAFLVDLDGDIINHPFGSYQMTVDKKTNISELNYSEVTEDGTTTKLISDYDGKTRILIAAINESSRFKVYVVCNFWTIYGRVVAYATICLVAFLLCIILVYRMLTNLMQWQAQTNQRLKESAKTAIAAGKAKTQFLAQMSHEIRTPINAVLGMNEMILHESHEEEIREYAENIHDAGKNLLSIVNSILDFSRIEDGKMEILPVKYELRAMVRNLVNSVSERAKGKNLELVVEVDPTLPSELLGDDVRVTQVITNLLTNAVKYTEKGSVTFTIANGGTDQEFVFLDVAVRDTGIGIKQEDMGKLFESFERLEEKRNRNIEGTGLGMAIVTKLLVMMDSELKVESEYGKGSCFSFRLKQIIVDEKPVGENALTGHTAVLKAESKGKLYAPRAKVLVVDDNEMNRKVAKNLLKLFGVVPDLACSGKETIEILREKQYQIVFLDHMMPQMDGVETLDRLKTENLVPRGTTVIALTANAIVGAREMYLEAGFDDYLSKPIETDQLESKLRTYLPDSVQESREEEASGQAAAETEEKPSKDKETAGTDAGEDDVLEFYPKEDETADPFAGDDEILEFFPEDEEGQPSAPKKETPNASGLTLERLKELGLNTEAALRFCAGDEAFYLEMVQEYQVAAKDREDQLNTYLAEENWKDYEVQVHALKSASRTIGLDGLAEKAFALEQASENKDGDFVKEHHPELMEELHRWLERLRG